MNRGYIITSKQAHKLYIMLTHAVPQMIENKAKRDLKKFTEELKKELFLK